MYVYVRICIALCSNDRHRKDNTRVHTMFGRCVCPLPTMSIYVRARMASVFELFKCFEEHVRILDFFTFY